MRIAVLILLALAPAFGAQPDTPPQSVRQCSSCHLAQAKPHPETSMAHAAEAIAKCGILVTHPLLTTQVGSYVYKIERRGDESFYTVSDSTGSLTLPIKYAFGLGEAGQTYILQHDDQFLESFVSYYKALDGLDITLGDQPPLPHSLNEAAGRRIGAHELSDCFGCHTTNSLHQGNVDETKLTPGVQCERCHGPTENHLAGLKNGDAKAARMPSIKNMTAEDSATFCGQCHRTFEYVAEHGPHNIANVRFQPYRLSISKCFDADDKRISCTACHNPHENLDRTATGYDSKCQACHAGGKSGTKICKVSASGCSACHMPKVELPGSHHLFTDHDIRIVSKNERYPL